MQWQHTGWRNSFAIFVRENFGHSVQFFGLRKVCLMDGGVGTVPYFALKGRRPFVKRNFDFKSVQWRKGVAFYKTKGGASDPMVPPLGDGALCCCHVSGVALVANPSAAGFSLPPCFPQCAFFGHKKAARGTPMLLQIFEHLSATLAAHWAARLPPEAH